MSQDKQRKIKVGPIDKIVSTKQLKSLMRLKPTLADTAAFFECSERSIERKIRKDYNLTFVEFREQNMVHTRLELIRTAIGMAMAKNVPMMIFCLKNLCGWSDKQELSTGVIPTITEVTFMDGKEKLIMGTKEGVTNNTNR